MKKLITIFAAVAIALSSTCLTVFAEPPIGSCSVTRYSQEKSNWCWAACSKMIGHFHGHNKTQSQIVVHVKNANVNEAATDSEVVKAIKYACGSSYTVTDCHGTIPYEYIQNYITRGLPFVIKINWAGGGAHVEVLSAYDASRKVTLIDPWSNRENRKYLYRDLINGTYLFGSKGTYVNTFTVLD